MAKKKILNITTALSTKYKLTQKDAEGFVTMMFDVINEGLQTDKQVKVKGLGTFKVSAVKDRESVNVNTGERVLIEGHDKITFTPDTTLRDFVNKPFAQFETVVVKEGVDFSDLDKTTEPEKQDNAILGETAEKQDKSEISDNVDVSDYSNSQPEKQFSDTSEKLVAFAETPKAEVVSQIPPTDFDEQLAELNKKVAALEVLPDEVARLQEEVVVLRKRNRRNLILAFVLAVIAFIAGFFIGRGTAVQTSKQETKAEIRQEAKVETAADSIEKTESGPAAPSATPAPAQTQVSDASFEAYNSDPRIKYGAYDIVGIDTVITLRPGQTLQSICRATLGADMMSYMEVMNDDKSLETGKVIVPKLKMRNFKK